MTHDEFKRAIERHGILQTDIAHICGVTPRTVGNWASGRKRVPKPLSLLLTALNEGRVSLSWLATKA